MCYLDASILQPVLLLDVSRYKRLCCPWTCLSYSSLCCILDVSVIQKTVLPLNCLSCRSVVLPLDVTVTQHPVLPLYVSLNSSLCVLSLDESPPEMSGPRLGKVSFDSVRAL